MSDRQKYLKWRMGKLERHLRIMLCSKLYIDRLHETGRSIFIAGTGRSGTTWLADIIATQGQGRILFEPFHPFEVSAYKNFNYFQYMRPDDEDPDLLSYCRTVLTGEIRHPWVDRQVETLRPAFRVIKEIRGNLFLKWMHSHFPKVPILFIIRHPCAVVLSRMKLNWATDTDIAPFLAQQKLIEDHLGDYLELIQSAGSDAEKHAIIWCISNLVPLKQFKDDHLQVVFYEDLCMDPEKVIPEIYDFLGRDYDRHVFETLGRFSTTSRSNSAVVTGNDLISGWEDQLSSRNIQDIRRIVKAFDLDYLYEDGLLPSASGISIQQ